MKYTVHNLVAGTWYQVPGTQYRKFLSVHKDIINTSPSTWCQILYTSTGTYVYR